MKMTNMKWLVVGAPIALVALVSAGIPLASLLPFAIVLACPLMMMGMHGGHGNHGMKNEVPNKSSLNNLDQ
jgi:hypothetical protein